MLIAQVKKDGKPLEQCCGVECRCRLRILVGEVQVEGDGHGHGWLYALSSCVVTLVEEEAWVCGGEKCGEKQEGKVTVCAHEGLDLR